MGCEKVGLFLVFLVLSIPLLSADAQATYIRNVHAYGRDMIEDYRRKTDTTTVQAEVKLDDDAEISGSQVRFGSNPFDSCEAIGRDAFSCSYTSGEETTVAVKKQSFKITLLNDDNETVKTVSSAYYVDNFGPEIRSFAITPNPAGDVNLTLTYSVVDFSYSQADATHCTGVSSIVVTGGNGLNLPVSSTGCTASGLVNLPATDLVAESGSISLCMIAYDRFSQNTTTPSCISFTADLEGSNVESVTFLDESGNEAFFIPKGGILLSLVVNVTDVETGVDSVTGDLSALNEDYSHQTKEATCKKKGDISVCAFKDLLVKIDSEDQTEVVLTMLDKAGNSEEYSFTPNLQIDDSAPFVSEITSGIEFNNTKYLKANNNTIMAAVSETGSGLANVTLNIGGASYDMNCSESCIATGININAEDGLEVTARLSGSDKVGNALTGNVTAVFLVDSLAPSVESVEINATGAYTQYNVSGIVVGDSLDVFVDVTDSTSTDIMLIADFSDIVTSLTNVSADCLLNDSKWGCRFLGIGPVDRDGERDITFTTIDNMGNTGNFTHAVDVLGVSNDTDRDDYDISILFQSPDKIDRQTTSLTNQRVYVELDLEADSDVEPLNVIVDTCDTNDTLYLAAPQPEIVDMPADMRHPWLKYVLAQVPIPINVSPLEITCYLKITSILNGNMIVTENQSFQVSIVLYNLPMGEYGANVYDEIKKIKDSELVSGGFVQNGRKFMQYSDMMCNMITVLQAISAIWSGVTEIWSCLAHGYPPAKVPQAATGTTASVASRAMAIFWKAARIYCAYNSCNYFDMIGQIGNWGRKGMAFGQLGDRALNVKNSLIMSTITLCYPGVIYNLDKAREIECGYLDCLMNDVPSGLSPAFCQAERGYQMCKFVIHEQYASIPFMSVADELARDLATMITAPETIINVALGFLCMIACPTGTCGMCTVCTLQQTVNAAIDTYNMIANKQNWEIQDSICDKVLQDADDIDDAENEDRERLDI